MWDNSGLVFGCLNDSLLFCFVATTDSHNPRESWLLPPSMPLVSPPPPLIMPPAGRQRAGSTSTTHSGTGTPLTHASYNSTSLLLPPAPAPPPLLHLSPPPTQPTPPPPPHPQQRQAQPAPKSRVTLSSNPESESDGRSGEVLKLPDYFVRSQLTVCLSLSLSPLSLPQLEPQNARLRLKVHHTLHLIKRSAEAASC